MSDNGLKRIFETMLKIRRFEEGVYDLHKAGEFGGHYHLYIGQEATGASVMHNLGPDDQIFSTHRNHGHAIARGVSPEAAYAEILGRATGSQGGRGGTFHLADADIGMPHTSALVGGAVPLAAGAALAAKQNKTGSLAAALFGDGCFEEGVVYETLNLARLWKLPVIFVCENNTPGALEKSKGGNNTSNLPDGRVADTPRALKIETFEVDGSDALAVGQLMSKCKELCLSNSEPVFIEALTERWPGNMYSYPDMVTGVTDLSALDVPVSEETEHADWFKNADPILKLGRLLLANGSLDISEIEEIDSRISKEVMDAKHTALGAPPPNVESFENFILAGEG
jgi:TPP-dependent pyruvate/acetoin dehydrogenase alpha subunit